MRRFLAASLFTVLAGMVILLSNAGEASAQAQFLTDFVAAYPNTANTKLNNCNTCHQSPSFAFNQYGQDFKDANRNFAAIENIDSDGDTFSNLAEITANPPTFPGDVNDSPPPTTTTTTVPPTTTTTVPPTTTTTRPSATTATAQAPTTTRPPATTTTTKAAAVLPLSSTTTESAAVPGDLDAIPEETSTSAAGGPVGEAAGSTGGDDPGTFPIVPVTGGAAVLAAGGAWWLVEAKRTARAAVQAGWDIPHGGVRLPK